jgi:hypothetical protein
MTVAAALVAVAATPSLAAAKALRGSANDPTGDAPALAVDIVTATTKFEPGGKLRIRVTTAAPLALTEANQLLITFAGRGCERDLFGASAILTDPALPWVYRLRGASAKSVNGRGTIDDVRYTLTFQTKQLVGLKPVYFQAAIYAPGDRATDPLDQTDCVALK